MSYHTLDVAIVENLNQAATSKANAIVTERTALGTLADFLLNLPTPLLPEYHMLVILKQVAEGMLAVHDHGIIHRGISPRAIHIHILQLDQDDESSIIVKIGGFDLSVLASDVDSLTSEGESKKDCNHLRSLRTTQSRGRSKAMYGVLACLSGSSTLATELSSLLTMPLILVFQLVSMLERVPMQSLLFFVPL